jgi:glycosyltransferase involved in cell wall biosynthesis
MSTGLPVVATAVGGTPEVVRDGENGLLIGPMSNGALSDALAELIELVASFRHGKTLAS